MSFVIAVEDQRFDVPESIADISEFREWVLSVEFPDEVRAWWIAGQVWVEMGAEQVFTHVRLKTAIAYGLFQILEDEEDRGWVLGDGVLLSNFEADISGKPDITFVSHETSGAEKVRQIEGKKGGVTELQGSPDLVVEVISNSSVQKDTVKLREAYWKAGIREYWLADARSEKVRFSIFRYTKKGYVEAKPSADGWLKSSVVGRSFRISQKPDVGGAPKFKLEID